MSNLNDEFEIRVLPGFEPRRAQFNWLSKCEAILGLTATFFIGFSPVVGLGLGTIFAFVDGKWGIGCFCTVGACVTAWLAGRVAAAAGQALPEEFLVRQSGYCEPVAERGFRPFAVEMALRMPIPSGILRPLMFLWWLSHFAAGLVLAYLMHGWLNHGIRNPTLFTICIPIALHLSFMVAANIYLTLTVATLGVKESTVASVWRMRFAIDLLLALVVGAISLGV